MILAITNRCDGHYELELFDEIPQWLAQSMLPYENAKYVGCLSGISSDQLAYATQSSESLVFVDLENERDICRANILSANFNTTDKTMYISFSGQAFKELHSILASERSGVFDIEFEVRHGFFNSLHKAIVNISNSMIHKLMPKLEDFQEIRKQDVSRCMHACLEIDKKSQLQALTTIVSASSKVPILLSGPFGCGKTRILARSAFEFIESGLQSKT